jgi:anti-sigma regulatory factor (Ser/Thr protein kinase)
MEVATSSVLVLPYTASSVGVARRRLISDLTQAGVYEGTACDAGLVISELISNALRHATPLPGRTVKVAWRLRQDSVEVAVSDGGGPTVPVASEPANSSIGGRGLGIVARLSLCWGVCVDGHPAGGHPAGGRYAGGRYAGDHLNGGGAGDGHGDCPREAYPGETTVWAELPVRYGSPASLVTASSRDA